MKYSHLQNIALAFTFALSSAYGANQTATTSPVLTSGLNYGIEMNLADTGSATLPTLQSFAAGSSGNYHVFVAGRTNGMHDFTQSGVTNFPPASQNTDIWVYDSVAKQSWSRSLNDSSAGVSADVVNALSATATQSTQVGDTLYVAGGYVYESGVNAFKTFDTLTALDLGSAIDWVKTGTGSLATSVRQTSNSTLKVTGGEMHMAGGKTHLVFGQDFDGPYTPGRNGVYTKQVRSFDIVDDGTTLSIANATASTPDDAYRRRDMNIVKVGSNDPAGPEIVALSGVFTETDGAWTVPVEIAADGSTSMADPNLSTTFKQGLNGYNAPTVVLFSPTTGENNIITLGGISLVIFDGTNFVTDNNLPFTGQGSAIVRAADGTYLQYYLGDVYPDIIDGSTGDPLLFGSSTEFLLNSDLSLVDGVVNLDLIAGRTLLGHVFGGIAAEADHGGDRAASDRMFEVWYNPVPEPANAGLILALAVVAVIGLRRRV